MMSTTTIQKMCEYGDKKFDFDEIKKAVPTSKFGTDYNFKRKIVWKNVLAFVVLHLGFLYGVYLYFTEAKWLTFIYFPILAYATGMGVTAGAHRLFSHKSYKATFSLRLILIILQTMTGQNCLYIWVRDHRQHHKYSDTDADPHNARRGFFFSHMGWLMARKHPLVIAKGKTIDVSDLEADPLVMFQMKYYNPLYVLFAIIIPVYIPVLCWGEIAMNSLFINYFFRYVLILHVTWTVNSIAHIYGNKPFNKHIVPVESIWVSFWSAGEGWHNYHHTFPWDYKTSEFGAPFNTTTSIINLMAFFGLAYDLKVTSDDMIKKRVLRTGDGTHPVYGEPNENVANETIYIEESSKETLKDEKVILARG